jgi:hypothetical protein
LVFGDAGAGDMALYHDGTNNYINTYTGDLILRVNADDKDIIFQSDDGSGGTETYFYLDGSLSSGNPFTIFPDNSRLGIGTGADLYFLHNGTDSQILNTNGDLYIVNYANDKDIILQSDDGSGGATAYLTLDGSAGYMWASKAIRFADGVNAQWGASADLVLRHNGTTSYIENYTGNLDIKQHADDSDIIFYSDDGSGGSAEYFRVDGGVGNILFSKELRLLDGVQIQLGTSLDMLFMHNGANGAITNNTGNLIIKNNNDDGDIIFECDDGSGGIAEYFRLDGGLGYLFVSKTLNFADNVPATFGPAGDLNIRHDGTDSSITNNTGDLYVRNTADDKDIIFKADAGGTEAEIMRIDGSTGRVGIGTNSPNEKLHVLGDILIDAGATNTNTGELAFTTQYNTAFLRSSYTDPSASTETYLAFHANTAGATNGTVAEQMRIAGSNVGIGTTSPTKELDVRDEARVWNGVNGIELSYSTGNTSGIVASANTSGNLEFRTNIGSTAKMFIANAGNVGIGTNSPSEKLHVEGRLRIGTTPEIVSHDNVGIVIDQNANSGADYFYIKSGATERFRLTGSGNVGIGTTSPSEKLHVSGDARIGSSATNGHLIGRKDYSVTQTFSTGLTVTLADHTACHVKVFISGDWSNHSSFAYVGEFFIQNTGNVGSYNEPGIILTEHDNLTTDGILSQIVDGTSDSFEIQFRANTSSATSVSGRLCYHVMGDASAVS